MVRALAMCCAILAGCAAPGGASTVRAAADARDAASYFRMGLDQQSGSQLDREVWFDHPLRADLAAGRITRAQVSAAVRRILRSLYAVGADQPSSESPIDYEAHADVAQRIAAEGIVPANAEEVPLRMSSPAPRTLPGTSP